MAKIIFNGPKTWARSRPDLTFKKVKINDQSCCWRSSNINWNPLEVNIADPDVPDVDPWRPNTFAKAMMALELETNDLLLFISPGLELFFSFPSLPSFPAPGGPDGGGAGACGESDLVNSSRKASQDVTAWCINSASDGDSGSGRLRPSDSGQSGHVKYLTKEAWKFWCNIKTCRSTLFPCGDGTGRRICKRCRIWRLELGALRHHFRKIASLEPGSWQDFRTKWNENKTYKKYSFVETKYEKSCFLEWSCSSKS